jgi:type I restriction enzyme S subunit
MTTATTQIVPDGWRETTLGDVVITNARTVQGDYPFEQILYLDTGSITKGVIGTLQEFSIEDAPSRAKRLVREEDIVYSTVRPMQEHYGFIEKPEDNLVVSTGFAVISTKKDKAFPKYIYYFLSQSQTVKELQQIAEHNTSAYPALNPEHIEGLSITLPSLIEQKAIADVLSSFDDKIELLREQNKTLEAMSQALFKHWFVDFEFPNKDGKPYKSSGGKMVGSELGEIPDGWRVGNVGGEFNITMGQSPRGDTYNENGVGTLFFQGRAEFGVRFPKARLYTTEPQRMAEQFDVLLSVRAPVGDINIASEDCCIGRGLASVNSKYKSYALYKIKSLKKWFNMFENEGTVFGSMNGNTFREIEVVIPDEKVIIDFEALANQTDAKFFNNHEQIQTLAKIRDTLLPKLMRGDVRVKI